MKYISPRRKTITLLAYATGGIVVALTAMAATYVGSRWLMSMFWLKWGPLLYFGLLVVIPAVIAFCYPCPTVGFIGGLLAASTAVLTGVVAVLIAGNERPGLPGLVGTAFGSGAFFVCPAVIMSKVVHRWRRVAGPDRCYGCGYLLIGLTESRCPECGQSFDPSRVPRASGMGERQL